LRAHQEPTERQHQAREDRARHAGDEHRRQQQQPVRAAPAEFFGLDRLLIWHNFLPPANEKSPDSLWHDYSGMFNLSASKTERRVNL
jgi:hypothetical protein